MKTEFPNFKGYFLEGLRRTEGFKGFLSILVAKIGHLGCYKTANLKYISCYLEMWCGMITHCLRKRRRRGKKDYEEQEEEG